MNRALSLYLDGLRFGAALVVLLSHFAYERFTRGDYAVLRELNLGSDAVVIFFVLSGLVIAYTADTKDHAAGRFAFNRLTRLWSVALPAVALTFAFDWAGRQIDPAAYTLPWFNAAAPWEQLLRALLFNSEWGLGNGIRIGTNGPYWSLSYEAAYYLLFGIAVFARGWARIAGLALAGALAGPAILLLLPAWLLGVAVYRVVRRETAMSPVLLWSLAIVPPLIYVQCLWAGLPLQLRVLTHDALGTGVVRGLLGFSDEFLWNWLIAAMVAGHLLGIAGLLRARLARRAKAGKRAAPGAGWISLAIRWGAGASFSLYLVHYPALQLFDTLLPHVAGGDVLPPLIRDAVLLAATLALSFAFAGLFERPIGHYRAALKGSLRRLHRDHAARRLRRLRRARDSRAAAPVGPTGRPAAETAD